MKPEGTLILTRSEIGGLMEMEHYIEAMEEAFKALTGGRSFGVGMIHGENGGTEFHIKAGGLHAGRPCYAVKCNGSSYDNPVKRGLPSMMGAIVLLDGETAFPLAVMDSIDITRKRTGATTALAAKYLAKKNSRTVTICGCGNQGRVQLEALRAVFPLEKAFAWDRDGSLAAAYAEEMSRALDMEVTAVADPVEGISRSDIVVTCTPSRSPYLWAGSVKPGLFIAAVGADSPDKRELEPSIPADNIVVTDITEQCARVGELHHALEAGLMTVEDVRGTLGEVIAGKVPGRVDETEIIIYDATGTAVQDAAAAAACYARAVERGVGTMVRFGS